MLLISDLHMHLQALFFFIWFTFTNCRVIYLLLNSCSIYFYALSFCSVFDLIWLVLLSNLAAKSFTNNMGLVEALYLVTNLRASMEDQQMSFRTQIAKVLRLRPLEYCCNLFLIFALAIFIDVLCLSFSRCINGQSSLKLLTNQMICSFLVEWPLFLTW
jgi:hypothetical protein